MVEKIDEMILSASEEQPPDHSQEWHFLSSFDLTMFRCWDSSFEKGWTYFDLTMFRCWDSSFEKGWAYTCCPTWSSPTRTASLPEKKNWSKYNNFLF
jgi:hypothetical protein